MSETGDRLRAIAEEVDNSPSPLSIAIIIAGPIEYELACVTGDDHELQAKTLAMLIEQEARGAICRI